MRTNIEIDDELMTKALASSGAKTKREVVQSALELLVRTREQEAFSRWRGKVAWEGNLERSRLNRFEDQFDQPDVI